MPIIKPIRQVDPVPFFTLDLNFSRAILAGTRLHHQWSPEMKKLLLCASVVLVCYFASDASQVPNYPVKTAPAAAIQFANK
jgi:hypothetical protein